MMTYRLAEHMEADRVIFADDGCGVMWRVRKGEEADFCISFFILSSSCSTTRYVEVGAIFRRSLLIEWRWVDQVQKCVCKFGGRADKTSSRDGDTYYFIHRWLIKMRGQVSLEQIRVVIIVIIYEGVTTRLWKAWCVDNTNQGSLNTKR